MHKQRAVLGYPLAKEILQDCFNKKRSFSMFEKHRSICHGILTTKAGRFLYARAMMSEVNRMLCDAFISSLPEAKQRFVRMKYRDNAELVSMSLKLYVSIAQLNIWNLNILEKLTSFLTFQLTEEDIFYRSRVINMVEILAKLIEFFERIDPEREIASQEYISCLQAKHQSYRKLLACLDDALRMKSLSQYYEVVSMKIRYPNESADFLSSSCHMDKGIVSRNIRHFRGEMVQYIMV